MPALLIIPALLVAGLGGAGFFVYRKFTGRVAMSHSEDGSKIWELEAVRPLFGDQWNIAVRVFEASGWAGAEGEHWISIGTADSGPAAMKVAENWLRDRGLWSGSQSGIRTELGTVAHRGNGIKFGPEPGFSGELGWYVMDNLAVIAGPFISQSSAAKWMVSH